MNNNTDHSLYSYLSKDLERSSQFFLHEKKNDELAHEMFESTPMKLSKLAEIRFSRKPYLEESFRESKLNPLMMVEKNYKAIGVIAESAVYEGKELVKAYYTSDLRLKSGTSIKVFKEFLDIYSRAVHELKGSCYTVILKDNLRAMKVLTSRLKGLKYWPIYEYESKSILILPTISFLKKDRKIRISKATNTEKLSAYIEKHYQQNDFSHPVDYSADQFIIEIDNEIKGTFSIGKPVHKKMLVKSLSKRVSLLLYLAKILTGKNYKEAIPWKYITNFMIDDDLKKDNLLKTVLRFLKSQRLVSSGDLLLFCHELGLYQSLGYIGPVITTNGILFKINDGAVEVAANQKCSVNPMYL